MTFRGTITHRPVPHLSPVRPQPRPPLPDNHVSVLPRPRSPQVDSEHTVLGLHAAPLAVAQQQAPLTGPTTRGDDETQVETQSLIGAAEAVRHINAYTVDDDGWAFEQSDNTILDDELPFEEVASLEEAAEEFVSDGELLAREDLDAMHQAAWSAAQSRARQSLEGQITASRARSSQMPRPSDDFFHQRPWWSRHNPPREPHHLYENPWNGNASDGDLWHWKLLLSEDHNLGLCYYTFGTPSNCELGLNCRWSHTIEWEQLRFLIVSGRVSVLRAQIMMANWKSPQIPELSTSDHYRMLIILCGLNRGPRTQFLGPASAFDR
jgi:ElaB/YqjD/DUF883 family membrane-anchored ribosome-binding protein